MSNDCKPTNQPIWCGRLEIVQICHFKIQPSLASDPGPLSFLSCFLRRNLRRIILMSQGFLEDWIPYEAAKHTRIIQ